MSIRLNLEFPVFVGSSQIAKRLILITGDPNRRQFPCPRQLGQPLRALSICLYSISRPLRNQRRGSNDAFNTQAAKQLVQPISCRARLIAGYELLGIPKTPNESPHIIYRIANLAILVRATHVAVCNSHSDLVLGHIQTDVLCDTIHVGWPSSYVALHCCASYSVTYAAR